MYRLCIILASIFYYVIRPPRVVVGRAYLKTRGAAIYCINHRRASDPIEVSIHIPRVIYYMSKKELFQNRFTGWFLRTVHAFPVDRGAGDVRSIRTALSVLEQGHALGIFPEGTRHPGSFDVCEMQNGTALLALKSGAPVVPMFMDAQKKLFTRTRIYVGAPLKFALAQGERLTMERCTAATEEIWRAMQALAETAKAQRPIS